MRAVGAVQTVPTQNKHKKQTKNMTYSSSMALSRHRLVSRTQRQLSSTPNNNWTRNQNTVGWRGERRGIGPISNTIILIVLACLLGLLYLTQVTKTNAYGYTINSLKVEQSKLNQQHDELEVASARLQSIDRVKNSDQAKNLVSAAPSATLQN